MSENDNVIHINFKPEVFDEVFRMIKFEGGPEKTRQRLLGEQFRWHPSFVKAVMKKIMHERGW